MQADDLTRSAVQNQPEDRIRRLERIVAVAFVGVPENIDPSVQAAYCDILDIREELGFPDDYDPALGL